MSESKKPVIVSRIRSSRRWHSRLSILLAILLAISAVTGVLLGWKKDADWLQPPTQKGTKGELTDWQDLQTLVDVAQRSLLDAMGQNVDTTVDRLDVRPGKNIVKVRFEYDNYEVQVDGISAEVLSIGKRNADWIEQLHDGSIISDGFKFVSMNVLGIGLCLMIFTGLWLYIAPKVYRARRRRREGRL